MNIRRVLWRARRVLKSWRRIYDLADAPVNERVRIRKSRIRRLFDLSYIAIRWDEYSTAYYAQGGDAVGVSVRSDLITVGQFNDKRDSWNKNKIYPDEKYSVVFEDKLLFERYFGGQGLPVVRSFGLLFPDLRYFSFSEGALVNLRERCWHAEFQDAFCKPLAGSYGKGAFRVLRAAGRLDVDRDDGGDLSKLDVSGAYLVQERVEQHRDLARFHAASLNTLRLVSFIENTGEVRVLAGFFRMGTGGAIVDNASAGGVVCGFDISTGVLNEVGYLCSKNAFAPIGEHPTSLVRFESTQLPWFDEALELARRAHRLAPWIRSVGWDVAITETGPILVEGNDWWGPLSLMWIDPDFVNCAFEVFSSP